MSGAPADGPPRSGVRRTRRILALWGVVGIVVWNGVYDLGISLGVREYLVQALLHESGRGAYTPLREAMAQTVSDAAWRATFWTALVVTAAAAAHWRRA